MNDEETCIEENVSDGPNLRYPRSVAITTLIEVATGSGDETLRVRAAELLLTFG